MKAVGVILNFGLIVLAVHGQTAAVERAAFFVRNGGQAAAGVLWQARGPGYQAEFGSDRFTIKTRGGNQTIAMDGISLEAKIDPLDPLPGKVSFFLSKDPSQWVHGLPTYARLRYKDVYPGIDLLFYQNQGGLEYDFLVAPGAHPQAIRLRVQDDAGSHVTETGELETSSGGEKLLHRPMLYQNTDNGKRAIEGRFAELAGGEFGFAASDYDPMRPLVIDPAVTLIYATYLSGNSTEGGGSTANSVAVDTQGNSYVAGSATDFTFPVSGNAVQPYYEIEHCSLNCEFPNGVLAKFSASGVLQYSTYLGSDTTLTGVRVDSAGNAYVLAYVGNYSYFSVYPTTPGAYPNTPGATGAVGISKISPDGSELLFSVVYGGATEYFSGTSIAVDQNGAIYVGGEAGQNNTMPTTPGAYQTTAKSPENGFIVKFDPSQTGTAQLVYATFLGGSQTGGSWTGRGVDSIAVDSLGQVYAAGATNSSDFPLTANAQVKNNSYGGCLNNVYPFGFLTILNASGSGLVYSSYVGGHRSNSGYCGQSVASVALGPGGNIYMYGSTSVGDLPVKNAYQSSAANGDGFVIKWSADGTQNLFTTYVDLDLNSAGPNSLAVDSQGNAWIVGVATNGASTNLSTANGIYQGIDGETIVAEISADGSQQPFATSIAPPNTGSTYSYTYTVQISSTAIAMDPQGNLHIAGTIRTNNMPVTPNAFMSQLLEQQPNIFLEIIGAGGIDTISPMSGGNSGDVTLAVSGSGFQQGAACTLTQAGSTIQAANVSVSTDGSTVTCTFALNGASPGSYAVTVTNPGGSPSTSGAQFTVQAGGQPNIWSNIIGRSLIRTGVPSTFEVSFGNSGTVDAYFVQFNISIPRGINWVFPSTSTPGFTSDLARLNAAASPGVNGQTYISLLLPHVPAGSSVSFPINLTATAAQNFSLGTGIDAVWFDSTAAADAAMTFAATEAAPPTTCSSTPGKPYLLNCLEQYLDELDSAAASGVGMSSPPSGSQYPALPTAAMKAQFRPWAVLALQNQLPDPPAVYSGPTPSSLPSLNPRPLNASRPRPHDQTSQAWEIVPFYLISDLLAKIYNSEDAQTFQQQRDDDCVPNPDADGPPAPVGPCIGGAQVYLVTYHYMTPTGGSCGSEYFNMILPCDSDKNPNCPSQQGSGQNCSNNKSANSVDPNYKCGPVGDGSASQYVPPGAGLSYNVGFENEASASLPASQVVVTDQLDPTKVDLTTLALGNMAFGSTIITPPSGVNSYATVYSMNSSISVRIQGSLNPDSGLLTWTFTTIDPSTGLPPTDPTAGFLPPDADGVEGQGSVSFTAMPKAGLSTGTPVNNQATVVFDANAPINTQTWLNTIDADLPVSSVSALPPSESAGTFPVSWSGTDVGSGIGSYTIYASDNGGPFTPWLTAPAATTSANFIGEYTHTYAFYSIATDGAGNIQAPKSSADSGTSVGIAPVGACDIGNYGTVTAADLQQIVNQALGTSGPANDLNGDGIVNVVDVQIVANAALQLGCAGQ